MSKRQLSRQQKWRIEKIQQERLARAKRKNNAPENLLADQGISLENPECGQIISNYGVHLLVRAENGDQYRCRLRQNLGSLVCGDLVVWQRQKDSHEGVINARENRKSELSRPDNSGRERVIASNIDQLFIVCAPLPEIHEHLIDRYLVAAESRHFDAIIVINKSDLLNHHNRAAITSTLKPYQNLGYPLLHTSIYDNVEPLRPFLRAKTSIFVGQSGVGKSSLINTLLPSAKARIGPVSEANEKGTHTTSVATLYPLPDDNKSFIIDSPGVREFTLGKLDRNEVFHGFREFAHYHGQCRFRNCRHQNEPGCALLAAEAEGKIYPARLKSYRRMIDALE